MRKNIVGDKPLKNYHIILRDENGTQYDTDYSIIRSSRRSVGIVLSADGALTVRAPYRITVKYIESLLLEKQYWIVRKKRELLQRSSDTQISDLTAEERSALEKQYRRLAAEKIPQRVGYYSSIMNCTFNRISIRSQKTRWGSCSSRGNLSFNWKLVLAPEKVLDYVVIHELCHLTHMDHSRDFWALVEHYMPDYRTQRKWLRDNGHTLF